MNYLNRSFDMFMTTFEFGIFAPIAIAVRIAFKEFVVRFASWLRFILQIIV